jgi:hypothetical protein
MEYEKLTPKIGTTFFMPDNAHALHIDIEDAHITIDTSSHGFCIGNITGITIYGLSKSEILKFAQFCIDSANALPEEEKAE